jgi:hypothetical protein
MAVMGFRRAVGVFSRQGLGGTKPKQTLTDAWAIVDGWLGASNDQSNDPSDDPSNDAIAGAIASAGLPAW